MSQNQRPNSGIKVSKNSALGSDKLAVWGKSGGRLGLDWTSVDPRLLAAAFSVCVAADVSLTIGAAQGGLGVVVTPYQRPTRFEHQYAASAATLHELLWQLIDAFSSESEDIGAAWGLERA